MLCQCLMGSVVWGCRACVSLCTPYFPALQLHHDQDGSPCSSFGDHGLRGQSLGERGCVRHCHACEALQSYAYFGGFGHFPFSWRLTDLRKPGKKNPTAAHLLFHQQSEAWGVMGGRRRQSLPHLSAILRGIPLALLLSALLLRAFGQRLRVLVETLLLHWASAPGRGGSRASSRGTLCF